MDRVCTARRGGGSKVSGGLIVLLAGMVVFAGQAEVLAQARPYIYGCGISWGKWQNLGDADAKEFDRLSMDKIVQMGGTNCPADFVWGGIEEVRGVYDWDYVDHQVDEAEARGLEIFAYSGLTPTWALPPEAIAHPDYPYVNHRFPPDEQYIQDFENFFTALAARYAGRVKYYEFWNEPNGCSWINDGCSNGHMAHTYVPWLIRWYDAMKAGDPNCVLAVGGLDYNEGVTHGYQYIEDIYSNGGGDHFDAVAIHPYGHTQDLHWQAITDTYQVLVNHGDAHKQLWLNEWGWGGSYSEETKAQYVQSVLETLKLPQYHMVFQANYLIISDLPGTADWDRDYGLCSRNLDPNNLSLTPRQSWYAYQAVDKTWPDDAEFTADRLTGSAPLTVQFTDQSTVINPTGWYWEFGDGGTSTLQHPSHVYAADGDYTVRMTVSGTWGSRVEEKENYIHVATVPPTPGVDNPGFEDNGGSRDGWELLHVSGEGPDTPPHSNATGWGVVTPFGSYYAGKITNWMTMNFYLGQVIGTTDFDPASTKANWSLDAWVQIMRAYNVDGTGEQRPDTLKQVWEIGWNDDGSEPSSMMNCDHYEVIADLDGNDTGNDKAFHQISPSGTLDGVAGLRGLALRVHLYTVGDAWWWAMNNIDNISFTVTSVPPPGQPGDFNDDNLVTAADATIFLSCLTGTDAGPPATGCELTDLDFDDDVDQVDLGLLQRCFTSSGTPADPNCAD